MTNKSSRPYETASGKSFMRSTQRSDLGEEGDKYLKSSGY